MPPGAILRRFLFRLSHHGVLSSVRWVRTTRASRHFHCPGVIKKTIDPVRDGTDVRFRRVRFIQLDSTAMYGSNGFRSVFDVKCISTANNAVLYRITTPSLPWKRQSQDEGLHRRNCPPTLPLRPCAVECLTPTVTTVKQNVPRTLLVHARTAHTSFRRLD